MVPVITTNVPGCKEAVIKNVTGLLVPARDSKKLAFAIKLLVKNSSLCRNMGRKARQFAERNFDIIDICDIHLKIYEGLVHSNKK